MIEPDEALDRLTRLDIELPSWAFGNSGTRFKVFSHPGTPRKPEEKIADAAEVHRVTGCAPSVALHIPWDRVDDFDKLNRLAVDLGMRIGTINTNTFQDDDYKLGSLTNVDDRIRAKAITHMHECIDIMNEVGSRDLKIWLPDGTNYPGQGDFVDRQERLAESLREVYHRLGAHQRLVLEYKLFEPAFYATDVPDWGTSYVQCLGLGDRAVVCLDTGHHGRGRISSSSWHSSCDWGVSVRSTSTPASTPTTISSSEPLIPSSSSGSSTRWFGEAVWTSRAGSSSCSTSATTLKRRSLVRFDRC